jgi:hypothetical protein
MILFASLIVILMVVLVFTTMDMSFEPLWLMKNRQIRMLKEDIRVLRISISIINGLDQGLSINSSLVTKKV